MQRISLVFIVFFISLKIVLVAKEYAILPYYMLDSVDRSFVKYDNNDTLLDRLTLLQWQDVMMVEENLTWSDAVAYCDMLVLDDKNDWRLPSLLELKTIAFFGANEENIFSDQGVYWSQSNLAGFDSFAWIVDIENAKILYDDKVKLHQVKCVRGSQYLNTPLLQRDDQNGIVKDSIQGLYWQDDLYASKTTRTWQEAFAYCDYIELGGYGDWRVPTLSELETIVDHSKLTPLIYDSFHNISSGEYWSANVDQIDKMLATTVNFSNGGYDKHPKDALHYLRCVRDKEIKSDLKLHLYNASLEEDIITLDKDVDFSIQDDNSDFLLWNISGSIEGDTLLTHSFESAGNYQVRIGTELLIVNGVTVAIDGRKYTFDVYTGESDCKKLFEDMVVPLHCSQSAKIVDVDHSNKQMMIEYYTTDKIDQSITTLTLPTNIDFSSLDEGVYFDSLVFEIGYDTNSSNSFEYKVVSIEFVVEDFLSVLIDVNDTNPLVGEDVSFVANINQPSQNLQYSWVVDGVLFAQDQNITLSFDDEENHEVNCTILTQNGSKIWDSVGIQAIKLDDNETIVEDTNISEGWNLLGATMVIENPKEIYGAEVVWSYTQGTWNQNPNSIEIGIGFWVKK
jgi:hypothetical protein